MINHAFTCLYGQNKVAPNGVHVDTRFELADPPQLASALKLLRGSTEVTAADFAALACKVIDGSTYQARLVAADSRITFDPDRIFVTAYTSQQLFSVLINDTGPAATNFALGDDEELRYSRRQSDLIQEMAAAVLIGVVDRITEYNNV